MGANHRDLFSDRPTGYLCDTALNIGVIVAVVTVYAINTYLVKPNLQAQFFHYYLNDLFAMPLILAYTNLVVHWVGRRTMSFTTPIRIGCLTIFCVIVWEGMAPMLLVNSTRDLMDAVVYAIGSFGYFVMVVASARRYEKLRGHVA